MGRRCVGWWPWKGLGCGRVGGWSREEGVGGVAAGRSHSIGEAELKLHIIEMN